MERNELTEKVSTKNELTIFNIDQNDNEERIRNNTKRILGHARK